jgi:hypothetical protein
MRRGISIAPNRWKGDFVTNGASKGLLKTTLFV